MGLLRLLLALAVVTAHAGPPGGVAALGMTGGPLAVQIFYVISGFYMTLILNEKYVGEGSVTAFAKSRLLRLLPMYFVVLLATALAGLVVHLATGARLDPLARWQAHGPSMPWGDWLVLALVNLTIVGQDLVSFFALDPRTHELFFTPDFHREAGPAWQFLLVPQAWTIGVELAFYAVAPLLVRRHVGWIAVMIAASLGLRVFLMDRFRLHNDPWTYRFFPTELALFLAGAFAWNVHRMLQRKNWLPAWACRGATVGMIACVLSYPLFPWRLSRAPYGLPLLLAIVPVALPFVFHATRRSTLDRTLGELSYPVYLVHYLLVFVVAAAGAPWLTQHRGVVIPLVTLALAWLLWRGVGRPLETRRQRIGERLAPAGAAPGW